MCTWPTSQRSAVDGIRDRGPSLKVFCQGLLEGAVTHAEGRKHRFTHQRGKWSSSRIHQRLLHDHVAAARVAPDRSRSDIDADGWMPGRRLSVQDLQQCWNRLSSLIAAETTLSYASRMTEELTKRHRALSGE